jgi:site-specific DNA-cytosine methylase
MKKLNALGVYIFAGGFTLGVRKHFNIVGHYEEGNFGVATAKYNIPKLAVHTDRSLWPINGHKGQIDYLYANPPCAPWSAAATTSEGIKHWSTNPLSACWRHTTDTVWALRPKVAHIESVRPIYTRGRAMLEEIAAEAKEHGYQANVILENALDCGLPQQRPRFVLCLTRVEYLASPTKGAEITAGQALAEYKAVMRRDGIKNENARRPNAMTIDTAFIKKVKPGQRLGKVFDVLNPNPKRNERGAIAGRPSFLKYRLDPDKHSPTQLGGASLFHPNEHRYLSIGEAAYLSGYPADFEFQGSISSCFAQMGKAVLPPVGEHLAYDAKRSIISGIPLKKSDLGNAREFTIGKDKVIEQFINWDAHVKGGQVPLDLEPPPVKIKLKRVTYVAKGKNK